jgi:hypothetical protein
MTHVDWFLKLKKIVVRSCNYGCACGPTGIVEELSHPCVMV